MHENQTQIQVFFSLNHPLSQRFVEKSSFHPFLRADRLLALVMLDGYVCGVQAVG
jgi:hypothetical protein